MEWNKIDKTKQMKTKRKYWNIFHVFRPACIFCLAHLSRKHCTLFNTTKQDTLFGTDGTLPSGKQTVTVHMTKAGTFYSVLLESCLHSNRPRLLAGIIITRHQFSIALFPAERTQRASLKASVLNICPCLGFPLSY